MRLLILFMTLLLPVVAISDPVVTNVSGTFETGESVDITGADLGVKGVPAPYKYDDFDDGVQGEELTPGDPPWRLQAYVNDVAYMPEFRPRYSDGFGNEDGTILRYTGDLSSWQQFGYIMWEGNQYYMSKSLLTIRDDDWDMNKFYCFGHCYLDSMPVGDDWYGSIGSRNFKIFSIRHTDFDDEKPKTRWDVYPKGGLPPPKSGHETGHMYIEDCGEGDTVRHNNWGTGMPSVDQWIALEYWFDDGTRGEADGLQQIHIDNVLDVENSGLMFTGTCQPHFFALTCPYYNNDYGGYAPGHAFWSEIYIDSTQARVMIGNASTRSASDHREIQIPTAWEDNSITIDFKQGSFDPEDEFYLYVIDRNGNWSNGAGPYEIAGEGGEPPSSVTPIDTLRATNYNP